MNDVNDFTFLSVDQIYGKNKLNIIKKYGEQSGITDFAILLGGVVSPNNYTNDGNSLKDRTGIYWTKTTPMEKHPSFYRKFPTEFDDIPYFIDEKGKKKVWETKSIERDVGARPVVSYSSIKPYCKNKRTNNGLIEVEYGEFPQTDDTKNFDELERLYKNNKLTTTGKKYTTDSFSTDYTEKFFKPKQYTEYEYKGNKYIRFVSNYLTYNNTSLSDNRKAKRGEIYWVRVEPIVWLVDEQEDIAVTKKIIFSGVRYDKYVHESRYFEMSEIKEYMDRYFAKEIIPIRSKKAISPGKKVIAVRKKTTHLDSTSDSRYVDSEKIKKTKGM